MAYDKRTKEQLAFDYAVKGWAFSPVEWLENKIKTGEQLALKLAKTDPRHETLTAMKLHAEGKKS